MRFGEARNHGLRARRRPVPDERPLIGNAPYDYADAFEIPVPAGDERSAEEWVRAGLEGAPPALRRLILVAHRHVLRLRLAPASSPEHVLGWAVVTSRHDVVQLEAASSLIRGVIVGHRLAPERMALSTFGFYRRPVATRLIWTAVRPLHRRIAPYLLERAAEAGASEVTPTAGVQRRRATRQPR